MSNNLLRYYYESMVSLKFRETLILKMCTSLIRFRYFLSTTFVRSTWHYAAFKFTLYADISVVIPGTEKGSE